MKFTKTTAALLAALMLLGSGALLAGCGNTQTTTPPTTTDSTTQEPATTPEDTTTDGTVQQADAQAMVLERLPDGYQATASSDYTKNEQDYFVFAVSDTAGKTVGSVAINKQTGARYNYNGETITPYTDFPTFDAATDSTYTWDGIFTNGDVSIMLLQQDNTQFDFAFSDGTQGFARITGNTATSNDAVFTFTFQDQNTLVIAGDNKTLAGTYTKSK